jgi:AraC-like DNA-binding protein
MLYVTHKPAAPLREFVDNLWFLQDAPGHRKERILPSGTIELVVNLEQDEIRIYEPGAPTARGRFSSAVVSGAYSSSFVVDTLEHATIMGVHFRPGGAFPFLGLPARELADAHVDLEALWGHCSAAELRERLCSASSVKERFAILEAALADHLFSPLEHHGAVSLALNAVMAADSGAPKSRDLADQVGLSQRQLIQVFSAEVGMPPKLFCRVHRFQRVLGRLAQSGTPHWAQLAVQAGYFDQAHLIRDFRQFSGLNPTSYLRQRDPGLKENHVPILD